MHLIVVHTDANTVHVIYATVSVECKLGPSWNITAICMYLLHPSYMLAKLFPFWTCYSPIRKVVCFHFSIVKNSSCFGASLCGGRRIFGGSRILRKRSMANWQPNFVREDACCSMLNKCYKIYFFPIEHFLFPRLVADVYERGCPFPLSVALIFHHCGWSENIKASFQHFWNIPPPNFNTFPQSI